jgi:hypothetical protein
MAPSSGMPSWLVPAIVVVVLALLAWWFFGRSSTSERVAEKPPATAPAPAATPAPAAPAAVDLAGVSKQASDTLTGLNATLAGITNADTAKAAMPKLNDAAGSLDKIAGMADKLPADAKASLKGAVGPAAAPVRDLIAKVTSMPGVGDVVKPATDLIVAKLDALTK